MLEAAGPALPDCDFFVNKRDYPHMRVDGGEPYARFTGVRALVREAYSAHAPVLSFYGGAEFADLLMPLTEDWKLCCAAAGGHLPPPPPPSRAAFDAAAPRAVWRGGATGYGVTLDTNPRLRLLALAQRLPALLDVGFTGVNCRDKLLEGGTQLGFLSTTTAAALTPLCSFMSLAEQAERFQCVVYVDGHCAANRYGSLMRCCRVILKVTSTQLADCGEQWLFPDLRGVCVEEDGVGVVAAACEAADHFVIHANLCNLEATLQFVRAQPDAAWRVAFNAWARAPTRDLIAATWHSLLHCVNAATTPPPPMDESTSTATAAWFSPFDPAYAALGSSVGGGGGGSSALFTSRVR